MERSGSVDLEGQGQALLHELAHLGLAADDVGRTTARRWPVLEDHDAERRARPLGEDLRVLHHRDAARRAEPAAGVVEVAPEQMTPWTRTSLVTCSG
jgi:hypothetical protein